MKNKSHAIKIQFCLTFSLTVKIKKKSCSQKNAKNFEEICFFFEFEFDIIFRQI